ncbi:acyl-ACP--UDP-N-acetylglucosamine O-acyltransferase [Marinicella sp. W31]|uniref:acyl-ACP--UDP-N-acetylglucosamine O-acyltransferase n=1 Tax=Marinicella sp. W31 TaxID=3023713 RepID=UPI0037578654
MIHPTAVIDPAAEVATDATIGPYCVIGAGVQIGSGCVLKSHVAVSGKTTIGKDNTIFPFSSIGAEPQDKKYRDEETETIIGDGNTIRENVTINRGTVDDLGATKIGNDNWIMAYVHVAHDCVVGDHTIMANCTTLAGHVHIGDWAILGGFTKVHQFCKIGAHAFTAMNADLQKDVPPFVMAQGSPAIPRAINFEGLKRRGFDKDSLAAIKKAYRLLYKSDLSLNDAMIQMQDLAENSSEVGQMVNFIQQSERSIIR